ncbi:hypothetical protein [Desulfitobacterium metallireducens]|uniref:Uncharacterized protein n=1 Tax=Desulfitobacterium metallireducens DSM 15288 TaxID=871968 RepID=W0E7Q0_9FIRM|nr:hypothetical protein [Desulfitobacterium metallireducens]AHF06792.1 hypothetical protein DESME_06740 [Desulfitobacterium metallireducens DSM 15288]
METISNGLRIIYDLICKDDIDNALWEVNELEQYLIQNAPGLIEKYHLKTYFTKWRNRLMRNQNHNFNLVLDEIELLANKFDNIIF